MNKDIAREWVDALRSGDYEQTTGQLAERSEDGVYSYCCLGVLCEIAVDKGVIPPISGGGYGEENTSSDLPYKVRDWAGLDATDPFFDVHIPATHYRIALDHASAASLNDTHSFTFDQIADVIEQNFLKETV